MTVVTFTEPVGPLSVTSLGENVAASMSLLNETST